MIDEISAPEKTFQKEATMKRCDYKTMSVDQLWIVHEKITAMLAEKIISERSSLENRLRQLNQGVHTAKVRPDRERARRPYPTVFPKFQNPAQPSETWAGRGKQPRWLSAQLRSGKQIDDFRIDSVAARRMHH
jgi:DNA-binding protein H-NS